MRIQITGSPNLKALQALRNLGSGIDLYSLRDFRQSGVLMLEEDYFSDEQIEEIEGFGLKVERLDEETCAQTYEEELNPREMYVVSFIARNLRAEGPSSRTRIMRRLLGIFREDAPYMGPVA